MADDSYRKEYPQHSRPEENQPRPQYPPPPPDNAQRPSEAPPASMAASVSLPSIHDSRSYGPPPSAPGRGYPPDPRYASPNAVNGYPPPGQQAPPPGQQQPPYLPPLQPQTDPRSPAYPPPDQRGGYYDDRRPPGPGYGQEPYSSDPYYAYRGQPPQGPPPPNGYRDYRAHLASGVYEYPPGGPGAAPQLTQAAPRQRTSIACRYCRKRKVCDPGYQSAPGGKCQNCARMNQECIFQPVSSSSSTAFIPVSAVPGGVPPGTQLFGAYGQPLAPSSVPGPHPQGPYQQHPPGGPPPGNYYPPVQSPTESFSSYGDARTDDGSQVAGRRRRRTSEEQDEGYRLPPPRAAVEEDPRRRSPAEFSNHSSPGGIGYPPYAGARQSPRNPGGTALPQQTPGASYAASAPGGRSPTAQNGSSGASTPARQQGQSSSQQTQQGNSSVMSLSNLVEKNDIDKTMIDRLNRPGPSPNQNGRRDASR
ncbi:hypothetical protein G7Z17_g13698 [Cylindrodendrum hubeiense]|uniref:Zn(2)-C6 fungal-type domain-containing protein n=1 Tax=Cylindrodendrum hubeiense TaxID=595255 RepID=A0A9P5GTA0_9HYPO|nr:hypothetical protein G7Z17_g13698 [Cylindrodendrum hubeiense]